MKKEQLKWIFLLLLMFVLGIGVSQIFSRNASAPRTETAKNSPTTSSVQSTGTSERTNTDMDLISQLAFDGFGQGMAELDFAGYTFQTDRSSLGNHVNAISRELAFGKRELLTQSGKTITGVDTATEKTVVFTNGTKILTLALMRNDQSLGDNFQGSDWAYMRSQVYCVPFVLSYKNIIILITLQDTENYVDYEEAIKLSTQLMEYLGGGTPQKAEYIDHTTTSSSVDVN